MNSIDITKLKRKQLIEHFERERQEWLSLGMSEADIFRIHFGEREGGRGGDYRMWLDERKHTRSDHKYAQGVPLSFDDVIFNCGIHSNRNEGIEYMEFSADFERALLTLTELQKQYFIKYHFEGFAYTEIALSFGKDESTIREAIKSANKKIEKFFA